MAPWSGGISEIVNGAHGELAEWSMALVLKTNGRVNAPRVRIPRSPQYGDCSSIGRVSDCGSEGWRFEPALSPQHGVRSLIG